MGIIKLELNVSKITPIEDCNGKTVCKVVTLSLEGKEFSYLPGQWANIGIPGFMHKENPEKEYMAAFSILSSSEEKDNLEFLIGIRPGEGLTAHIDQNLKVGDKMIVQGPFGHFTLNEETQKHVWAATGTGIAPFVSFLRTLKLKGLTDKEITLFYGCRNVKCLFLKDEIRSYKEVMPNFTLVEVLSDKDVGEEWTGKRGFVTPFVKEFLKKGNSAELEGYACGVPIMVEDVCKMYSEAGIPKEKIRRERFG